MGGITLCPPENMSTSGRAMLPLFQNANGLSVIGDLATLLTLRERPSGQRMNVGRHNNANISLLNGLVWDEMRRKRDEGGRMGEREPDSHSRGSYNLLYGFLLLERDVVAKVRVPNLQAFQP